jgi:hypothetical protein
MSYWPEKLDFRRASAVMKDARIINDASSGVAHADCHGVAMVEYHHAGIHQA